MKILVANLGSTSFKYKLFDMPAGRVLARGGMDRIGGLHSVHTYQLGDSPHWRPGPATGAWRRWKNSSPGSGAGWHTPLQRERPDIVQQRGTR